MANTENIQFNLLLQGKTIAPTLTATVQDAAAIVVPMVVQEQPQSVQKPAQLTETGTVPLVSNPVKSEDMGLKVEGQKTANTATKSKRTIDEAMGESYKKIGWNKMTDAQKQEQIIKHITTVDKKRFNYLATKNQPDGRIGWLKSFLLNERMDEKQSRLVIGALKKLNVSKEEFAELQAQGVVMAFDDDNRNQKACQLQVAEDMSVYGKKAQKVAIVKTSTSKFDEVKVAGSLNASKVDASLQEFAVTQYMEGSKTSSVEIQKQIGFNLVDQYGQYAKEVEVNIHRIISTSNPNVSEIAEYAAKNIYNLHAENQAAAVQVTVQTGNEKAIAAAKEQIAKCDASAQEQIKSTITKYETTKAKSATKPTVTSPIAAVKEAPKQTVQTKLAPSKHENVLERAAKKLELVFSFLRKTEETQEPETKTEDTAQKTKEEVKIQEQIAKIIDGDKEFSDLSQKEQSKVLEMLDRLNASQREKIVIAICKTNPKLASSIIASLDSGLQAKMIAQNPDLTEFIKNTDKLSQGAKETFEKVNENKS